MVWQLGWVDLDWGVPPHSAILSVGKVTMKSEYSGQSCMEWPLICYKFCMQFNQGLKRYGNPDMPFLGTLKNKYQISIILTIFY